MSILRAARPYSINVSEVVTPRPAARTARRGRRRRQHRCRRHGTQQLRLGVPLRPGSAPADRRVARRAAAAHHARARGVAAASWRNRVRGRRRRGLVVGRGVLPCVQPHLRRAAVAGGRCPVPAVRTERPAFPSTAVALAGQRRRQAAFGGRSPTSPHLMIAHDIADTAYLINQPPTVERTVDRTRSHPDKWSSSGTARNPALARCSGRSCGRSRSGWPPSKAATSPDGSQRNRSRTDPSSSRRITLISESDGAQWFPNIPRRADSATPSSTRCAIRPSRFSSTASSRTC